MPRSDSAAMTTPEDFLETDNLSNWGSEQSSNPREEGATTIDNRRRLRRMSAPSSGQAPLAGASNRMNRSAKTREGSTSTSAPRGAVVGTASRERRAKSIQRDNNGDNRPAWNGSTKQLGPKSRRRSLLQPHTTRPAAPSVGGAKLRESAEEEIGRGRQVSTRRRVKRASIGSIRSIASLGGIRGIGVASDDNVDRGVDTGGGGVGEDSKDNPILQDEDALGSAAPSQEEIRTMIERIRLQTKDVDINPGTAQKILVDHEALAHSSTRRVARVNPSGGKLGSVPAHRRAVSCSVAGFSGGTGGTPGDGAGVAAVESGALGMVEIEEEERRLQEQASKLQSEMSALKKRRLEVRLVKVEQQLKEEAASRLLHRESRVRAAVERACAALRKERDDRVKEVTVIKQDLRNKLDKLSAMYEQVSVRLEHLKGDYETAEDELRESAKADQLKAVEREDRGVRRRMRALVTERGKERPKERLALQEALKVPDKGHNIDGENSTTVGSARAEKDRSLEHSQDHSTAVKKVHAEDVGTSDAATLTLVNTRALTATDAGRERSMERCEPKDRGTERRRSIGDTMTNPTAASRRRRRMSGEM